MARHGDKEQDEARCQFQKVFAIIRRTFQQASKEW